MRNLSRAPAVSDPRSGGGRLADMILRGLHSLWDARFALLLLATMALWSVLLLKFFGILDQDTGRTGLVLFLAVTGVCFLAAVLISEWLGIHNLWKVDGQSLAFLEYTHPYLPSNKHIITTLLLTVAIPLSLWQFRAPTHAATPIVINEQRAWQIANDSSTTWAETRPAGNTDKWWNALATSSDGTHLIAGVNGGRLYISSDAGSTWTETRPAGDVNKAWYALASSSDGTHLVAGVSSGRLYISSNSGVKVGQLNPDAEFISYGR